MSELEKESCAKRLKDYEVKFIGQDRNGIANLYDTWSATTYEKDIDAVDHRGRFVMSEKLARVFQGDKECARILDVGAGSGMLAEELLNKGFKLIDALDGSQGMLELAKSKGFYQNYFCNFIEETQGIIEDETYDIVCSLGVIGPGHLESAALGQMFRVTKPGGLICISGVKERWDGDPEYHQRMRSVIAELEASKKLKMLDDSTVIQYYFYQYWHHGVLLLMQKINS
ncbi:methyltransferase-like protein 27 [Liolophura sinensis]|uniref:methyltransferase-like protein 27 n=1 Tax=Liolophura sinensis TaxID=3198878 RepID=UPI00315868E8